MYAIQQRQIELKAGELTVKTFNTTIKKEYDTVYIRIPNIINSVPDDNVAISTGVNCLHKVDNINKVRVQWIADAMTKAQEAKGNS